MLPSQVGRVVPRVHMQSPLVVSHIFGASLQVASFEHAVGAAIGKNKENDFDYQF